MVKSYVEVLIKDDVPDATVNEKLEQAAKAEVTNGGSATLTTIKQTLADTVE